MAALVLWREAGTVLCSEMVWVRRAGGVGGGMVDGAMAAMVA